MKTLYQRWFIEFEFPNNDGKPYKSSGGKLIYNDLLKRDIPENWEAVKISNISELVSGFTFSSDDYCEEGNYKLYTIKNVQDGNVISKVDNKIKEIPLNMPQDCLLKPMDIIMSLTGNVGRVGIVYENNVLLNQRVLKLKPKDNMCMLYSVLRSDYIKSKCESISTGTSQENLSPIEFEKIFIPYNKNIASKYESECFHYIKQITNNLMQNKRLTELKEFLLPMLMNGQINVDDIEI